MTKAAGNDPDGVDVRPKDDTSFRNCVCAILVLICMCVLIVMIAAVTRLNSPQNMLPDKSSGDKNVTQSNYMKTTERTKTIIITEIIESSSTEKSITIKEPETRRIKATEEKVTSSFDLETTRNQSAVSGLVPYITTTSSKGVILNSTQTTEENTMLHAIDHLTTLEEDEENSTIISSEMGAETEEKVFAYNRTRSITSTTPIIYFVPFKGNTTIEDKIMSGSSEYSEITDSTLTDEEVTMEIYAFPTENFSEISIDTEENSTDMINEKEEQEFSTEADKKAIAYNRTHSTNGTIPIIYFVTFKGNTTTEDEITTSDSTERFEIADSTLTADAVTIETYSFPTEKLGDISIDIEENSTDVLNEKEAVEYSTEAEEEEIAYNRTTTSTTLMRYFVPFKGKTTSEDTITSDSTKRSQITDSTQTDEIVTMEAYTFLAENFSEISIDTEENSTGTINEKKALGYRTEDEEEALAYNRTRSIIGTTPIVYFLPFTGKVISEDEIMSNSTKRSQITNSTLTDEVVTMEAYTIPAENFSEISIDTEENSTDVINEKEAVEYSTEAEEETVDYNRTQSTTSTTLMRYFKSFKGNSTSEYEITPDSIERSEIADSTLADEVVTMEAYTTPPEKEEEIRIDTEENSTEVINKKEEQEFSTDAEKKGVAYNRSHSTNGTTPIIYFVPFKGNTTSEDEITTSDGTERSEIADRALPAEAVTMETYAFPTENFGEISIDIEENSTDVINEKDAMEYSTEAGEEEIAYNRTRSTTGTTPMIYFVPFKGKTTSEDKVTSDNTKSSQITDSSLADELVTMEAYTFPSENFSDISIDTIESSTDVINEKEAMKYSTDAEEEAIAYNRTRSINGTTPLIYPVPFKGNTTSEDEITSNSTERSQIVDSTLTDRMVTMTPPENSSEISIDVEENSTDVINEKEVMEYSTEAEEEALAYNRTRATSSTTPLIHLLPFKDNTTNEEEITSNSTKRSQITDSNLTYEMVTMEAYTFPEEDFSEIGIDTADNNSEEISEKEAVEYVTEAEEKVIFYNRSRSITGTTPLIYFIPFKGKTTRKAEIATNSTKRSQITDSILTDKVVTIEADTFPAENSSEIGIDTEENSTHVINEKEALEFSTEAEEKVISYVGSRSTIGTKEMIYIETSEDITSEYEMTFDSNERSEITSRKQQAFERTEHPEILKTTINDVISTETKLLTFKKSTVEAEEELMIYNNNINSSIIDTTAKTYFALFVDNKTNEVEDMSDRRKHFKINNDTVSKEVRKQPSELSKSGEVNTSLTSTEKVIMDFSTEASKDAAEDERIDTVERIESSSIDVEDVKSIEKKLFTSKEHSELNKSFRPSTEKEITKFNTIIEDKALTYGSTYSISETTQLELPNDNITRKYKVTSDSTERPEISASTDTEEVESSKIDFFSKEYGGFDENISKISIEKAAMVSSTKVKDEDVTYGSTVTQSVT